MTKQEFEQRYDVRLVLKTSSWLMQGFGWFMFLLWIISFTWLFRPNLRTSFMEEYWTTYRMPFCKTKITYPSSVKDPMEQRHEDIREHELLHHIHQLKPWWGPLVAGLLVSLFPLPILFSGRWFLERKPYLHNIVYHDYDIQSVVDNLWVGYLWPWPKSWMFQWLNENEQKMRADKIPNPFKS